MWKLLAIIFYVCFYHSSNGIAAGEEKGKLVAFGDDLADTGNLQCLQNNTSIGNNSGRMTNGPVFVEYMATLLNKQLLSMAYTNSTIDNKAESSETPSLEKQVLNFTETERDWIRRKSGPKNSIAVVSAGTNDVIYKAAWDLTAKAAQKLVDRMVKQIGSMEKLGFGSIVISNLPAIYVFPRWRMSAMVDGIREFVETSNMLLRKWLVDHLKEKPDVRLWLLDIEEFMLVTANSTFAKEIGARNSTGSCTTEIGTCTNPDDFVFYDDLHMDSRLHHLLGIVAADMVQGADVKYDAEYLGQMARKYDIGVLYHTPATVFEETQSLLAGGADMTADLGDPLITSTTSVAANCTLATTCTSADQASQAYEQQKQQHGKNSCASRLGRWSKQKILFGHAALGILLVSATCF
ncbi:hypothetical protein IWW45_004085 [Coemansia sp. RSA 485]|nr:hypothetical protein IWW45_004085 [Coemansia sp. RSA 485]